MSGHRSSFKVDKDATTGRTSHAKSTLAHHCFDEHPDKMELIVFKFGSITSYNASELELDREETRLISKFRTGIIGLNIIKVIK